MRSPAHPVPTLALALAVACAGCVLEPIDHAGQLAPCLPGYVEDAGRCWRAPDAGAFDGGPRDAAMDATRDAGDCTPGCDGDEIVMCTDAGALRAPSVCAEGAVDVCRGGTMLRVTCPGACLADPVARCEVPASFGVIVPAIEGSAELADVVIPAGETWTFDTQDGRIQRGDGEVAVGPGTGILFQQSLGTPGIGIFAMRSLRVEGTLRASGRPAIALVAQTRIVTAVGSRIDVSADGATAGPGGGPGGNGPMTGTATSCAVAPSGEGPGGGAGGLGTGFYSAGGGGGGLGTAGGEGGGAGAGCSHEGGAPGVAVALDRTVLRGGSGGGAGADRTAPGLLPAVGGAGGGAASLVAGIVLEHRGVIDASGGGGGGGGAGGGGAGGGSGGVVWIEAPRVERLPGSTIGANGGGGGAAGSIPCARDGGMVDAQVPDGGDAGLWGCGLPPAMPGPGEAGEDGAAESPGAGGAISSSPAYAGSGGDGSDALGVASPGAFVTGTYGQKGGGGGGGGGRIVIRTSDGTAMELGAVYPSADGAYVLEAM